MIEVLPSDCEVHAVNLASVTTQNQRDLAPQKIIKTALERFGKKLALVSSFGAESVVLLHMISEIAPDMPILFLDTGQLFGQTLDYRKTLAAGLGLQDVRDLRPAFTDLSLTDPDGKLWKTDTDSCCHIRKVVPLNKALEGFEAWITGRKRFHGGARLKLAVEEKTDTHVKFNPLANWGKKEIETYIVDHALPVHPLIAFGYHSIGCWPCTKPVTDGEESRAGRWQGQEKTECGIHITENPGSKTLIDLGEGL